MEKPLHVGKPQWLKSNIPAGSPVYKLKKDLRERSLFTVCEEAKCPNIHECWNKASATIMIMGDTCTRACRFCHVKTGNPAGLLDPKEPENTARTCKELNLKYVVITMVDRDDLPDHGAQHIVQVIKATKEAVPHIGVELLAGDMHGDAEAFKTIIGAKPEVFAHNIETTEALSPRVRDRRASYRQSLNVLSTYKALADYPVITKSALMLGLGETEPDIKQSLLDLRAHNVDIVTLGQYMRPTKQHLSVKRWVHPDEFALWEKTAFDLGFAGVASSPLVRSSYRAHEFYLKAMASLQLANARESSTVNSDINTSL